jgi:hypothetical protein
LQKNIKKINIKNKQHGTSSKSSTNTTKTKTTTKTTISAIIITNKINNNNIQRTDE